jgi:hypothetical protein
MALSISKSQQNYLKTVHLNEIGDVKTSSGVKLEAVEEALIELAVLFKVMAEKKLDIAQAISSNFLAESIQFEAVKFFGGVYSIDINVASYYKFVDAGVKGIQDEKGGSSPYSFKNLHVSKSFQEQVRKWLIREGLKVRTSSARKLPIKHESKGHAFKNADKTSALAYAVATSIKKKGLKPTHFWTDTAREINARLAETIGQGFAIDLVNELTRTK